MKKKTIVCPPSTHTEQRLVAWGVPHEVTRTNQTTTVETSTTRWIQTQKALPVKYLNFVGRVRKYALSCDVPPFPDTAGSIKYFQFSKLSQNHYEDVTEIDVNSAYWNIAHRLGIISDDLYEEGQEVPKMARLVALGALATMRYKWKYNGERYSFHPPKLNEDERRVRSYFFGVAGYLDRIMRGAIDRVGEDSVLWYWVDAFFVKKEKAAELAESIAAHGLAVKEKPINSISVSYHAERHADKVTCYLPDGDSKYFYRPHVKGREKARFARFVANVNAAKEIMAS